MKDKKQTILQFLKFAAVGVLNTLVDMGVFYILTNFLDFSSLPAQVISYTCGVLNSYFFNSIWTFKREHKRSAREFALFVGVNLATLALSAGLLQFLQFVVFKDGTFARTLYCTFLGRFFESAESLNAMMCKIISLPFTWVFNFLLNKLLVFKRSAEGADKEK